MSLRFIFSGRPPTLWWLLMTALGPLKRDALDDVGIERALHEPLGVPCTFFASSLEDLDEDAADDLPLLLGIGDARERREEPLARVDRDEVQVEALAERRDDLLGLALPQQPVVDEDAREPVAEGRVAEDGGDGRVDPAREAADARGRRRPTFARTAAMASSVNAPGVHVGASPATSKRNAAEDVRAARRVDDLGVELDAVDASCSRCRRRRTACCR